MIPRKEKQKFCSVERQRKFVVNIQVLDIIVIEQKI